MHQGHAFEKAVMVGVSDNRHRKLHGHDTESCQFQQNWCVDFDVNRHIIGNLSACLICISKNQLQNWLWVSGEVLNTQFLCSFKDKHGCWTQDFRAWLETHYHAWISQRHGLVLSKLHTTAVWRPGKSPGWHAHSWFFFLCWNAHVSRYSLRQRSSAANVIPSDPTALWSQSEDITEADNLPLFKPWTPNVWAKVNAKPHAKLQQQVAATCADLKDSWRGWPGQTSCRQSALNNSTTMHDIWFHDNLLSKHVCCSCIFPCKHWWSNNAKPTFLVWFSTKSNKAVGPVPWTTIVGHKIPANLKVWSVHSVT